MVQVKRYGPLRILVSLVLSGGYTVIKFISTPFLYLVSKITGNEKLAYNFDASVNRRILPLTEKPDQSFRKEITPYIKVGDNAPEVKLGSTDNLIFPTSWSGKKLLLILFRGNWCSYSRLHLQDFSNHASDFGKRNVHVLAVTANDEQEWWLSKGINLQILVDPEGQLFDELGVVYNSRMDRIWGRILPHESVFLFDENGRLIDYDIRKVSGIKPFQKFSGASSWLKRSISN